MSSVLQRVVRIVFTWAFNTLNSVVFLFSAGRRTRHEGRYSRLTGIWRNWSLTFHSRPETFATPVREEEICDLVRRARSVRVVGAGHTFNSSPLSRHTMISLDRYHRILEVNYSRQTLRVQAGIRLRDLNAQLQSLGLALPVLGSTDAQSLGGLIATDLHGTGRAHGFLSEQVRSLRIVDARGEAKTFRPGDPEFHAAIGGIGACGIVTEVELQCMATYNLERSTRIVTRAWAEEQIETLLAEHRHLSFYYLGGVELEHVRMNVWNETQAVPRRSARLQRIAGELIDMLFSGYLFDLAKLFNANRAVANFALWFFRRTMDGRKQTSSWAEGFGRRLYYRHDELEYGVSFEVFRPCLEEVMNLLRERGYLTILEIRFTPETSSALLGPGVGRRTCYINVAPSLSGDPAEIFPAIEAIFLRYGGQAHLGKATRATGLEMQRMFGERFSMFQAVRRRQDPDDRFGNAFVRRLFEAGESAGS